MVLPPLKDVRYDGVERDHLKVTYVINTEIYWSRSTPSYLIFTYSEYVPLCMYLKQLCTTRYHAVGEILVYTVYTVYTR